MPENLLDDIQDNVANTDVDNRAFNEEKSYENNNDQRNLTQIELLKTQVIKLELKNRRYKDLKKIRNTN